MAVVNIHREDGSTAKTTQELVRNWREVADGMNMAVPAEQTVAETMRSCADDLERVVKL